VLSLTNKIALITGASRRIGPEIAEVLAKRDAITTVHYANGADLAEKVVASTATQGGKAFAVSADLVTATGMAEEMILKAAAQFMAAVAISRSGAQARSMTLPMLSASRPPMAATRSPGRPSVQQEDWAFERTM
jgi:NAD(P)-dependent dehydrogenase (short-subunit alcohol dehydrogenase family)